MSTFHPVHPGALSGLRASALDPLRLVAARIGGAGDERPFDGPMGGCPAARSIGGPTSRLARAGQCAASCAASCAGNGGIDAPSAGQRLVGEENRGHPA